MYRIELTGSLTASCEELDLSITRRRHGVIDELARLMIEQGANPADPVEVYRGETLCFTARSLIWWAERRLTEPDNAPFRVSAYRDDERYELEA